MYEIHGEDEEGNKCEDEQQRRVMIVRQLLLGGLA